MCGCIFAGPASLQCAETLRQNSYGGRIVIVSKDEQLPLDKTKLSKVEMLFYRGNKADLFVFMFTIYICWL